METINNIIAIDLGTITTVVETEKKSQIFESRLKETTDIQQLAEGLLTFEKDSTTFEVGEGNFEHNLFKYDKENFVDLMHFAVANNMKNGNVKLITGIPGNQYNKFKDELKNKIMNNNRIDLFINGKHKKITIEECAVLPEGYPIFKSTPAELLMANTKTVVIDVGGGTTDISYFDEKGKFIDGDSIDQGLLDLYKEVQTGLMDNFKTYKSIEESKEYFRGNLNFFNVNDTQDLVRKEAVKNTFNELFNKIIGKCHNLHEINVILAGGGAEVYAQYFKQRIPQTVVNIDITANAKAYYALGVSKWLRKR